MKKHHWTEQELNLLKKLYTENKHSKEQLEDVFKLPYKTIKSKANYLKLKTEWYWSKEDELILKNTYATTDTKQLAKQFNRSTKQINFKAKTLGITKLAKWSEEDLIKLRELYPITKTSDLVNIFKKSISSIVSIANRNLKIIKKKKVDIGYKFNRLTILNLINNPNNKLPRDSSRSRCRLAYCKCDCGKNIVTLTSRLILGYSRSCGCLQKENASISNTTHGKTDTLEYIKFISAKRRANEFNLEFNLDLEDIIIPDICPVLGIHLFVGEKTMSINSPSIDRIDNTKGYIKGNIKIISMKANTLKSDATIEQLKNILSYIVEYDQSDNIIFVQRSDKRIYHGKTHSYEYKIWNSAKKYAKAQNLKFNIEVEDIIIPEKCPILNIQLNKHGNKTIDIPSIDKIVPAKGYIKGNVKIISALANRLKNDHTTDTLSKIISYMENNIIHK